MTPDGKPNHSLKTESEFWNRMASSTRNDFGEPTAESLSFPFAYSSDFKFLEEIGNVEELSVLEVGCGFGTLGLLLAKSGGNVVELDLATEMVRRSRDRAISHDICAEFVAGDAQRLPFSNDAFDVVVGTRVLHHLPNIPDFFHEANRVLSRHGRAVFIEPQKKNPIVEFNRKVLQPNRRTKDEHPLTRIDIDAAREAFPNVATYSFYLISPISFLFSDILHSMRLHRAVYKPLQRIEGKFASSRYLDDYHWQVVIVLSK